MYNYDRFLFTLWMGRKEGKDLRRKKSASKGPSPINNHNKNTPNFSGKKTTKYPAPQPATSCAASVVAASVVASKPTDFLHVQLKSSYRVGPYASYK